jgi:hypothetical protein
MNPEELARRYDRCTARGAEAAEGWGRRDPDACAFAEWLAGFWRAACPAQPAVPPATTSRVGHDPAGLRWFGAAGGTVGYAAGHAPGCYWVPRGARPPETGESPGA